MPNDREQERGKGRPRTAHLTNALSHLPSVFVPPPFIYLQRSSLHRLTTHPTQSSERTSFLGILIMKRARFDSSQVSPPSGESAEHHPKISRKIRACRSCPAVKCRYANLLAICLTPDETAMQKKLCVSPNCTSLLSPRANFVN